MGRSWEGDAAGVLRVLGVRVSLSNKVGSEVRILVISAGKIASGLQPRLGHLTSVT